MPEGYLLPTASKCPGSLGGFEWKIIVLDSDPAPPLAEARVTPASYR